MKKHSVKGLSNIGTLLGRADVPPQQEPKRSRATRGDICDKTFEKIMAAIPLGANLDPKHKALISTYLKGAVGDAFDLGHAEALEQNNVVEALLDKQYKARTEMTMPAVVAGVMEQRGLRSMTLDLEQLATVFEREKIAFNVVDDTISYTLTPADEVADGR